jgi:hypothetical protein
MLDSLFHVSLAVVGNAEFCSILLQMKSFCSIVPCIFSISMYTYIIRSNFSMHRAGLGMLASSSGTGFLTSMRVPSVKNAE